MAWYWWILIALWIPVGFVIFWGSSAVDYPSFGDYMLRKQEESPNFYGFWFPILTIASGFLAPIWIGCEVYKFRKQSKRILKEIIKGTKNDPDSKITRQKNIAVIEKKE